MFELAYFATPNLNRNDAVFGRDSFSAVDLVRWDFRLVATPRAFRLEERKTPRDLTFPVAREAGWLASSPPSAM